jgi:hypothetical protein
MELLGPHKFQDSFAKEILRFNRGGIVRSIPDFYPVVSRNTCEDGEVISKTTFADFDR